MVEFRIVAVVGSVALLLLASLVVLPSIRPSTDGAPKDPVSFTTDAVAIPRGSYVTPLAPDDPVTVSFTLTPSDPVGLTKLLSAVDDPTSAEYHHFLTYPEYLARFAPTPAAESAVVGALRDRGAASITVAADRSSILATLPARALEAMLGVHLVEYGSVGNVPLFTATGTVVLPPALQGKVSAVDGLSDPNGGATVPTLFAAPPPEPLAPGGSGRSGSVPGSFLYDNRTKSQWFVGTDFTQAYGATELFDPSVVANATYPSNVAIATLLASGYNDTSAADLPPFDPAVVNAYFNDTFPAAWPKPQVHGVPVTIGSVTPPPPGSFGGVGDSSLNEWENSLDLEMAGSLAPGSSVYNFYFAGSLLESSTDASIASDFAQSLADALAYNYSPAHLGVVSGSFGLPDLNSPAWDRELEVAALMGVTVVVASGDQGNAPNSQTGRSDGQWPTWPASAAFNNSGAIAVGGVTLGLSGTPTSYAGSTSVNLSYDDRDGSIRSTLAWYDTGGAPTRLAGTEGGASTVYAEPGWQFHSAAQMPIVNATVIQGASALGRAEPDVAFAANTTIAAGVANATGTVFVSVLEGTSIAAPLFAGLLADVLGVLGARNASGWAPLGFLDPEIYRIASYYWANPSSASAPDPFLETIQGSNYVFHASAGWDALTGWGGLLAAPFLAALENGTVNGYNYTGPTPSLPPRGPGGPSIPLTIIYVIFGVGIAAAVALVLVMARPTRPSGPVAVPYGAQIGSGVPLGPGVQGGIYPGATFLCPYCGAVRPAEPVRCPRCGAL